MKGSKIIQGVLVSLAFVLVSGITGCTQATGGSSGGTTSYPGVWIDNSDEVTYYYCFEGNSIYEYYLDSNNQEVRKTYTRASIPSLNYDEYISIDIRAENNYTCSISVKKPAGETPTIQMIKGQ